MTEPVLRAAGVVRRLGRATVLRGVDLAVHPGRLVVLAGRSGSGKTTLCHLAAGVDAPDEGELLVGGTQADRVADWAVLSFLPQRLALAEELSVAENVRLPLLLRRGAAAADDADTLLAELDLHALADRPALRTSLGEQQRTALARALVLRPRLTVLDEPTSHQDDERVALVVGAVLAARDRGCAVLVATHDERLLEVADDVVELRQGAVVQGTSSRGTTG